MKRKGLAILLSALLILTLLPGTAIAAVPAISNTALDPSNVRVIIDFSERVYGNAGHNAPVTEEDFTLTFQGNGGAVTNMSITNVRTSDNTDPVGGETRLLIYFLFTGGPANGLETFSIGPTDGSSIYNASGEAMASTETTGTITLNDLTPPAAVCQIGAITYATLDAALAVVGAGQTATIRLLTDITYNNGISVTGGQNITFDLNDYILGVVNGADNSIGLAVTSGHVGYTGAGAFNVTGTTCGVSANGGGASANVTSTTATSDGGNGAVAMNGGDVVVNGNAQGGYNGVSVAGPGSTAVINGNATGTASDSSGARVGFGGSVIINGGTAQGVMYGAYANGENSLITINAGDAIGTGIYSHGVHTESDGAVNIIGNVEGTQYGIAAGYDTYVSVSGNVSATAALNAIGVESSTGATVVIGGNVIAYGVSTGAFATGSSTITIDGVILIENGTYIRLLDDIGVDKDGSPESRSTSPAKAGYYTYSQRNSVVWVKVPAQATVCRIGATPYATLDAALGAVQHAQTITLLTDITDSDGLVINKGIHININLGSYDLTITNNSGTGRGLEVTNATYVALIGTGKFNVSGSQYGVYVDRANVTVTNVESSGTAAVFATTGGVTVKENVTATNSCIGAWAMIGSTITINGKLSVTDIGKYVKLGANVTDLYPASAGVYPNPSTGYIEYKKDDVNTILVDSIWASSYPKTFNVLDESFILQVSADEICKVYYVVLPSPDPAPTSAQVVQDATGNTVIGSSFDYDPNHIYGPISGDTVQDLTPEESYVVYVVAEDSAGNLQPPVRVEVTTIANIDNVPSDAVSGITNSVQGAAGSKQVTLTLALRNAAGLPINYWGPGYFNVCIDSGPVGNFDNCPFSGFVNNGDGTYTVVFTGAADGTPYVFTNLRVDSEDQGIAYSPVIESSYTVTTPPAAVAYVPPTGVAGATSYEAEITAGTTTESVPVTVNDASGLASVNLTGAQAGAYFGGGNDVNVTMPHITGISTFTLGIPANYLSDSDGTQTLTMETENGAVVLPTDMLANNATASGKQAEISIGKADTSGLSDIVKTAIGAHPVIQLTLKLDGQQTEWNNPGAPVTVTIPYAPTPEELLTPESIVIWYIDGSGNAVMIPNGHYDASSGCVTFDTTHFSRFAVGYSRVNFSDVPAGIWYGKAVGFIAARGIAAGTGGGNFSPDKKLTRGEVIVMLMNAYGIAPDDNPEANFTDAGDTWYTKYLAAAKRLGISAGVGNNLFAPEKEITRQEMFTMLYNTLKIIDKLPEGKAGKALSAFSDANQIASWAKDAMTLLVETGTISGTGGRLYPTGTATRAEIAQVFYNLLSR